MIVMKFGGTSVKTADAMRRVADIVANESVNKPLVVLSACGGYTDKFLASARLSGAGNINEAETLIIEIENHHRTLCNELLYGTEQYPLAIDKVNDLLRGFRTFCEGIALLGECTPRSIDAVASFGELLSTTIFTYYASSKGIPSVFHDARSTMKTNEVFTSAKVQISTLEHQSKLQILPLLNAGNIVVTQGFIGSTSEGLTTTLGRGGSDLSAALYGSVLGADKIQIWTDVSGVLTADPRIIPTAKTLPFLTFDEVRELAYYGAKVLHPDTIKPAIEHSIPVVVLNTFAPESSGTTIISKQSALAQGKLNINELHAVTLRKNCLLLKMQAPIELTALELLHSIHSECKRQNIPILFASATESTANIIIDSADEYKVSKQFSNIRQEVTLLVVCGTHIEGSKQLARIANALEQLNPISLSGGVSDVAVVAVLLPEVATKALTSVHELL
jgi:aspartate kinase